VKRVFGFQFSVFGSDQQRKTRLLRTESCLDSEALLNDPHRIVSIAATLLLNTEN